jgi:hypothetical protein
LLKCFALFASKGHSSPPKTLKAKESQAARHLPEVKFNKWEVEVEVPG